MAISNAILKEELEVPVRPPQENSISPLPTKGPHAFFLSTFLFAFFGVLFLPLLKMYVMPSADKTLGGVEARSRVPLFSWESFLDGSFQSKVEKWFSEHLGYRGSLILTHNQINFSLFGFTSQRAFLGKDKFLFESFYIEHYNNLKPFSDESLRGLADRMGLLEMRLRNRGSKLLVFITPVKTSIHADKLPDHLRLSSSGNDLGPRFIQALQSRGIPVFDGVTFAKELAAQNPTQPVFPPGAAHWSSYVSCKAGERFTEILGPLIGKNVPILRCDPPSKREQNRVVDLDLAHLVNIWTTSDFEIPLLYPNPKVEAAKGAYLPKLLFVGDSFMWVFLHHLEKRPVYESRDFFYYYKTQQRFNRKSRPYPKHPIDPSKLNWQNLLSRDAIILEINEARIREEGYGFINDALSALNALDAQAAATPVQGEK